MIDFTVIISISRLFIIPQERAYCKCFLRMFVLPAICEMRMSTLLPVYSPVPEAALSLLSPEDFGSIFLILFSACLRAIMI